MKNLFFSLALLFVGALSATASSSLKTFMPSEASEHVHGFIMDSNQCNMQAEDCEVSTTLSGSLGGIISVEVTCTTSAEDCETAVAMLADCVDRVTDLFGL